MPRKHNQIIPKELDKARGYLLFSVATLNEQAIDQSVTLYSKFSKFVNWFLILFKNCIKSFQD